MFGNFISETCTGTTGDLTLTGAIYGAIAFNKKFVDTNPVSYFIEDSDGIAKCGGIGVYNTGGTITRTDSWTYDGTTYNDSPGSNMTLTGGEHIIRVSPLSTTMLEWNTSYTHSNIVTGNPHNVNATDIGLGNVDNTTDSNKPISTLTQTALDGKAPSLGGDDYYISSAQLTELSTATSNIVTNTAAIALNTAKITNATHIGEITGSTDLILDVTAITNKPAITSGVVDTDELLISDGGVLKRMDASVLKTYVNTGVNATTFLNYTLSISGDRFGVIPYIHTDGVMEIGKYIDFHNTDGDTSGNSLRLTSSADLLNIGGDLIVKNVSVNDTLLSIQGTATATLLIAGDTANSGDAGERDSRIVFSTDASVDTTPGFGYDFGALNYAGRSEFIFTEIESGTPTDIMRFQSGGNVEFYVGSVHSKFCMGDRTIPVGRYTGALIEYMAGAAESITSLSNVINKIIDVIDYFGFINRYED